MKWITSKIFPRSLSCVLMLWWCLKTAQGYSEQTLCLWFLLSSHWAWCGMSCHSGQYYSDFKTLTLGWPSWLVGQLVQRPHVGPLGRVGKAHIPAPQANSVPGVLILMFDGIQHSSLWKARDISSQGHNYPESNWKETLLRIVWP